MGIDQTFEKLIELPARALEAFLRLLKVTAPEFFVHMTGGLRGRGPVLPNQLAGSGEALSSR